MIEAHTADAWTRAAAKKTIAFRDAAIAAGIGMVTPIVRTAAWVSALPVWLQWYLRPTGDYTTFTMFPWAGFAFAGGAVGVLLAAARDLTSERRVHVSLSIAGAALIGIGFITAAQPTIYHASAYHAPSFLTSSPTWFAIRVGILIVALTAIYGLAALAERVNVTLRPLALIGRHSLFVYWIHVELVYGYASRG